MATDPTATAAGEMPEPNLTAVEAAHRIGVSVQHVHDLCREGELAHFRFGRAIRIPPAEIRRYLAASYVPAKEGAA